MTKPKPIAELVQVAYCRDTGTGTRASRSEAQAIYETRLSAQRNFKMNDTVRLLNNASDELNVGGVRYKPDASGAFVVPRHIADMVVTQPGGFYRGPVVAPAPQGPLQFNPNFGGVELQQ